MLPFPAAVSGVSLCLSSLWTSLMRAKRLKPLPYLFALPTGTELGFVPLSGTLCLLLWWMMSLLQPNCSQQRPHPCFSFLCGLLGERECVSHYLVRFAMWVPAGVHCSGITDYFFSASTHPSLMFNNGTVWRQEILVLGWLYIFNQKLRLKRTPPPSFKKWVPLYSCWIYVNRGNGEALHSRRDSKQRDS